MNKQYKNIHIVLYIPLSLFDMSYREGFLIFTQQPLGVEFSIPVRHIVKVSYSPTSNITKLDFIDGTSESFQTLSDEFYQKTKKEIHAELHPMTYSMPIVNR